MGVDQKLALRLQHEFAQYDSCHSDERPSTTKQLYDKAIKSLKDADFMTIHSSKLHSYVEIEL